MPAANAHTAYFEVMHFNHSEVIERLVPDGEVQPVRRGRGRALGVWTGSSLMVKPSLQGEGDEEVACQRMPVRTQRDRMNVHEANACSPHHSAL